MRIALLLLAMTLTSPAWARHAYPKFYFQVDHIRTFEYAISGNHWYPPTRENRRVVKGILAMNTATGQKQLAAALSRDRNLELGLRQLAGELSCLMYRYLAGEQARPLCFDAPTPNRRQTTPFYDSAGPYHERPLQLTYPQQPARYLSYRFRMTVPSGSRYGQDNPFYPLHRLGYALGGSDSRALVATVFLEVLTESKPGVWQPLTLSHTLVPLYLQLPSQQTIRAAGSAVAAFDLGKRQLRLLDYTGQRW